MSISPVVLKLFYSKLPETPSETSLSIVSCLKALEGLDLGDSNAIQKLAKVVKAVTELPEPPKEDSEGQQNLAKWKGQAQYIADLVVRSHFFGEIEREERDVFLRASSNNVHNFAMRFLELGRMAWNRIRYDHKQSKTNQNALCAQAVKTLQEIVRGLTDEQVQQELLSGTIANMFIESFGREKAIPGRDDFEEAFAKDIREVSKEAYTSWHQALRESVPARRKRRQWEAPQKIEIQLIPDEAQQTESKRPEWAQELIMQLQETLKTLLPKEDLLAIVKPFEIDWPPKIKENNDQGKANLHIVVLNLLGYEFQHEQNRVVFVKPMPRKGMLPPNFEAAVALLPQIEKAFGIANLTIENQEEPVAEGSTPPLHPEPVKRQRKAWDRPHQAFFPATEESAQPLPQETARGRVKPIGIAPSKPLSQKANSMMQKIQEGRFNSQTEKVNELSNEQWLEVIRECIAMARTETERQRIVVKVLNFIRDKLIPHLGEDGEKFKASLEQIPDLRQSDGMDLKTKTFRVAIGL